MSASYEAPAEILEETAPGGPEEQIIGQKQGRWFLPSLFISWFGLNMIAGAIVGQAIPRTLNALDPDTAAVDLSVISIAGGIAVMIITPLFGRLSDRSMSRWGIRKPWMLWGSIVGFAGVAISAFAGAWWVILIGWIVGQVGYGATNMAQHSLLADQVPKVRRGRVAGILSISSGIATILGSAIINFLPAGAQPLWYLIPAGLGSVLCLALVTGFKDVVRTEPAPRLDAKAILSTYWLNPAKYGDFAWAWWCRLLVTMSIVSVSLYLFLFVVNSLKVPSEQASGIVTITLLIFLVGNIVFAVLFGIISDRWGRRKPVVIFAGLVSAVGVLVAAFSNDVTTWYIAVGIIGSAQGAFISVDIALMTEVLPTFKDAGKDLGIVALSYQLPQILVPIVAIPVLSIGSATQGNYQALFITAAVYGVLGALAVIPIKRAR